MSNIKLDKPESHHLKFVLRAGHDQKVIVFDGQGREAHARITSLSGGTVELTLITETIQIIPPPIPGLTLIQAISKPVAMDMVIQKSVELGVSAIIPFTASRSVVRLRTDQTEKIMLRWFSIAVNAAKQCGIAHLPIIHPPSSLKVALDNHMGDMCLLASLDACATPFRQIASITAENTHNSISLMVGPEGDFTEEEHALAVGSGAIPVSLGPRILRVETAAISILTLANYVFRKDS
ncbi:MAG: 16S rRNA (uracil(1498)-N(3))-methyltransferase [Lentisphaerae bacterium]|nr:16S rRNA (uracil(1498)-N(3))-methyltransferase [Lentisphaerota bacterium]